MPSVHEAEIEFQLLRIREEEISPLHHHNWSEARVMEPTRRLRTQRARAEKHAKALGSQTQSALAGEAACEGDGARSMERSG